MNKTNDEEKPRGHAQDLNLGFTLLDGDCLPRNPTMDEFHAIAELFPHHVGTAVIGPFLVITVKELPKTPWPVSLAGLPLHLTTTPFEVPWQLGRPGNLRKEAIEHLDARLGAERSHYDAVLSYFENAKIDVSEVLWITGYWRVRIPESAFTPGLPGRLCQASVSYVTGDLEFPSTSCAKDPSYERF